MAKQLATYLDTVAARDHPTEPAQPPQPPGPPPSIVRLSLGPGVGRAPLAAASSSGSAAAAGDPPPVPTRAAAAGGPPRRMPEDRGTPCGTTASSGHGSPPSRAPGLRWDVKWRRAVVGVSVAEPLHRFPGARQRSGRHVDPPGRVHTRRTERFRIGARAASRDARGPPPAARPGLGRLRQGVRSAAPPGSSLLACWLLRRLAERLPRLGPRARPPFRDRLLPRLVTPGLARRTWHRPREESKGSRVSP